MRKLLTIILLAAGLAAGAQTTNRTNVLNKQVSRTSFVIWEWVDKDSTRAYQDTVPGVYKMFHRDNEPGFRMEFIAYYYDLEELYADETMRLMLRDWESFDLDSIYSHDALLPYNEYSADSFKANFRHYYGFQWNEPYFEDSLFVTSEEMNVKMDTLSNGEVLLIMSYLKIMEDSSSVASSSGSLYAPMEMDENEMFGVLANYDFSGQWLGRVHNVLYDTATFEPLSYYTMDSMMVVEFPLQDGEQFSRKIKPVEVLREGALGGDWSTELIAFDDSIMIVRAKYFDPYWEWVAKLIWVDQDTLKYIIEVAPVANEAMGNEIKEGQRFAWVWEFARITGIKEE